MTINRLHRESRPIRFLMPGVVVVLLLLAATVVMVEEPSYAPTTDYENVWADQASEQE